jgi:hypothetical protein
MGALIPITIMAALGFAYWWATAKDKKRRDQLEDMAQSLGIQVTAELPPQDSQRFERFEIAKMGRFQRAHTVLCADTGQTRMVVFDFNYVKRQGNRRIERFFSLVLVTDQRLQAPKLALEPESWRSMIANWVGARDIDFEDDAEFSAAFHLTGADEDAIRKFMHSLRRKALLSYPNMRLEVSGDSLLITKPHLKLEAGNVRNFMSEALTATQLMIDG